jgi:hypothetical protein
MTPTKIPLEVFGVDTYLVICSVERLKELAVQLAPDIDISELEDSSAGVVGNLIWIHDTTARGSIDFIQNLTHEISHIVDMIMGDLGLEGSECKAYMSDFIMGKALKIVQDDYQFKE